jgi:hypothetical protein
MRCSFSVNWRGIWPQVEFAKIREPKCKSSVAADFVCWMLIRWPEKQPIFWPGSAHRRSACPIPNHSFSYANNLEINYGSIMSPTPPSFHPSLIHQINKFARRESSYGVWFRAFLLLLPGDPRGFYYVGVQNEMLGSVHMGRPPYFMIEQGCAPQRRRHRHHRQEVTHCRHVILVT